MNERKEETVFEVERQESLVREGSMALKMGSPQLLYSLGHSDFAKLAFCIVGVMSTLVLYGLLQVENPCFFTSCFHI